MKIHKEKESSKKNLDNLEDLWGTLSELELQKLKSYWNQKLKWLKNNLIYFLAIAAIVPIFFVCAAVFWHFQIGRDIPYIEVKYATTAAHWGQIGDFVGGILNPLLSFAALIAVLYSLRSQNKELVLAREDAVENQRIQAQQSFIFERQNFESVFFRLLDIHSKVANDIKFSRVTEHDFYHRPKKTEDYEGALAFAQIAKIHFPDGNQYRSQEHYERAFEKCSEAMHSNFENKLSHYFRNLHQLMKHIDSFGLDSLRLSKPNSRANIRAWIDRYTSQRKYANMLRAQLCSGELQIIFLNCLGSQGAGLKYYIERFSLLKHMNTKIFGPYQETRYKYYADMAFSGLENIHPSTLRAHLDSNRLEHEKNYKRPSTQQE